MSMKVGAEPLQAGLRFLHDPLARQPAPVRAGSARVGELGAKTSGAVGGDGTAVISSDLPA